jgi:LPXTG-site transpeptidase (sortase) family protein
MIRIIYKYLIYIFIGFYLSLNNNYNQIVSNDYYFILNIPKINLSEKVYEYNDKNNDVNKGIFLAKEYDFNSFKGSLILASHSGNSSISHFKNLDKLDKDDIVSIIIDNRVIYYKIVDIFKIQKNGKFKYSNENETIYLVTCDKEYNKKQIVFKGKIIKICKKSQVF